MNSFSPVLRRLAARLALVGAVLALVFVVSSPVSASPQTLKRSVENLLLWPFDFVLSPVVAGKTVYTNLQDIPTLAKSLLMPHKRLEMLGYTAPTRQL